MADSKIQIAVEVVGADKANKQIQSLENSSIDLKEGVSGVGEGFKSVGELVKAQGGLMGDALGTLGDSVIAVTDSVFIFKEGMATAGATGAKAWLGLLGPIAAVIGAVALAVDAFRQLSGATREAEMWQEAMSATASDLTSRLEALAETGIKPTVSELKGFIALNQQARFSLEVLGLKNETLVKKYQERDMWAKQVSKAEKQLIEDTKKLKQETGLLEKTGDLLVDIYTDVKSVFVETEKSTIDLETAKGKLKNINDDVSKSELELARIYENEVIPQLQAAKKAEEILNKTQVQLEDDLLAKLREVEGYQISRLDSQRKNRDAIELIGTATQKYTESVNRRKEKERQLQDQLKRNIITQDQYEISLKKLKEQVYDETKALEKLVDQERKLADEEGEKAEKRARSEELSSKAFENRQRIYDREVDLINREKQELLDLATTRSKLINLELDRTTLFMANAKTIQYALNEEADGTEELTAVYQTYYSAQDLVNKQYSSLSKNAQDYIMMMDLMGKKQEELTDVGNTYVGTAAEHDLLITAMTKETRKKAVEEIMKADLKLLEAQRDFQLKNRTQLKLSQKQIEDDFKYHSDRLKQLAKKDYDDRLRAEIAARMESLQQSRMGQLDKQKAEFENNLIRLDQSKKLLQIQSLNEQQSELASMELNQKLIEIDNYGFSVRQNFEKKYYEDSKKIYQNSFNEKLKFIEEMYTVEGKTTVEGMKILKELVISNQNDLKELDTRYLIQQENTNILAQENNNRTIQNLKETLTYEMKHGEERLGLLQTLFLTEDQIRERAKDTIEEQNRQSIKSERDLTYKQRMELEKRVEDQIKYEQYLAKIHKQIAENTMVNLAKEKSFDPKNEAELRQNELRIQELKDSYDLEIGLYRSKEEQIAEIQAKGTIEKEKLLKKETDLTKKYKAKQVEQEFKTFNTVGQMLKDFGDSSTQALISSGVAAAFAGENIANALKQTLRGLAQEATAKSLLEGAYALGALAIGDEKGASMHGLAALKFGMAALAVGAMSTIGGSPATGGGASSTTSPTATPQATATETRPEARDTQPIVYNINFGGSVIYDTREAAMRAFSNQITQLQSRAVRGTQSARMMNRG